MKIASYNDYPFRRVVSDTTWYVYNTNKQLEKVFNSDKTFTTYEYSGNTVRIKNYNELSILKRTVEEFYNTPNASSNYLVFHGNNHYSFFNFKGLFGVQNTNLLTKRVGQGFSTDYSYTYDAEKRVRSISEKTISSPNSDVSLGILSYTYFCE
jgi:hypothetical protein